jgi:hypothetical protein
VTLSSSSVLAMLIPENISKLAHMQDWLQVKQVVLASRAPCW